MPVDWLAGFAQRHVTNRFPPRRAQLGRAHSKTVDTILLHSTEGSSAAGAFAAYDSRAGTYSGGVHPHCTVDPVRRQRFQHVPLTKASYSLKRGDADGVIQIEIVGFAAKGWTDAQCRWLGEAVVAPIIAAIPTIPLRAPVPFLGPEAGTLARPWPHGKARLSPTQWAGVAGIVGHQHAPHDDHWDPGAINIAAVIDGATPAPTPTPKPAPASAGARSEETDMVIANNFNDWRLLIPDTGPVIATSSPGVARIPDATVDQASWNKLVAVFEKANRLVRAG